MNITNFMRIAARPFCYAGLISGLLFGTNAMALTVTSSGSDGNVAANTIDNNLNTRWSANGIGQWIQYDLGGTYTVDDLSIAFYKGTERYATIEIQVSTDKKYWTTVFYGVQPSKTNSQQNFNITDTAARYVKIIGHGNTSNNWVSLTEVDINTLGGTVSSASSSSSSVKSSSSSSSSSTATGGSIPAAIYSNFEAEGSSPYVNGSSMVFQALVEKVVTSNGNGWRHELKLIKDLRQGMTKNYEYFKADVKVDLSKGGKLIALQYHAEDTGTIVKVYVSDSDESGFINSVAKDGIFDVYVRMLPASGGSEQKYALGTIKTGESFTLTSTNNYGTVTVAAFGKSKTLAVSDGGASYLKFGNYLQSQDPVGSAKCSDFAACYAKFGITTAKVTMSNVSYSRK
ncbi:polysaccharide lyase family 7 protein [Cellvibrio sp. OA-2007]|uniref:polysaccharide lyase family 7 protein n=1 Tax=Cellvibrio sp. OA-2007 TaxID=529823 RepID=UPI000784D46B|nr:polysaccharide lyase family 7 protein [Cellvibrio sp. OA-2007]